MWFIWFISMADVLPILKLEFTKYGNKEKEKKKRKRKHCWRFKVLLLSSLPPLEIFFTSSLSNRHHRNEYHLKLFFYESLINVPKSIYPFRNTSFLFLKVLFHDLWLVLEPWIKEGTDTHCDFDGHRKFDKAFRKRSVNNFSVLYSQTNPYS